jgi:uncharacterized repeat protein (TIGR03803 family)
VLFTAAGGGHGYTLDTLYDFCAEQNCTDGQLPGPVVMDRNGRLFGYTHEGGTRPTDGVIFLLDPRVPPAAYGVVHNFCAFDNCADGGSPVGPMISDVKGRAYGLTGHGGARNGGTLYSVNPHGDFVVLYDDFCSECSLETPYWLTYQGAQSGALYDGVSPIYGLAASTDAFGGTVIFTLTPPHGRDPASLNVIYRLCTKADCPYDSLDSITLGEGGTIFGIAGFGGRANSGYAIQLTPKDQGKYKKTVLHDFCAKRSCKDGDVPVDTLAIDSGGKLIGATRGGGRDAQGTVFSIVPTGGHFTETVIHAFCHQDCSQGAIPFSAPVLDAGGNMFGATSAGGTHGFFGTIYEISGGTFTSLYSFCALANCADGTSPMDAPVIGAAGNIYGTTQNGGSHSNNGTIFVLKP